MIDEEFEEEVIGADDVGEIPAGVITPEPKPEPKLVRMAKGDHHITVNSADAKLFKKLLSSGWTVLENPPEGVMGNLAGRIKIQDARKKKGNS